MNVHHQEIVLIVITIRYAVRVLFQRADIIVQILFKFLEESGYKIEIENCIECGEKVRETENFFDPKQGGIICKNCSVQAGGKVRINSNSVKIIRIFFQNSIKSLVKLKIDRKDLDNIKLIGREFLRWTA